MSLFQGIILGLVQGLTEFIPVSSSGHLVLAHKLLGGVSSIDLSVDATLQLATVLAVLVYFWRDILRLINTFLKIISRKPTEDSARTLLFSIIIGTIPGVFFGLLLESYMETIFRNAHLVAYALIGGSILMYLSELFSKGGGGINLKNGFKIGLFQVLALIPGVSRSGATISGGLFLGLSREEATRFSFLLSLPIIFGSGMKKIIDLWSMGEVASLGAPFALSFLSAFIIGIISIHFLIKYLKNHSLNVFVWYRLILAVLIIFLL